jgi:hypothetical protein
MASTPANPKPEGSPSLTEVSAPPRRISSHLIVTGVVLVASAATLMGMRAYGARSGLTFEAVTTDVSYKEDAGQLAQYDKIMADLSRVNKPLDVALEDFGHSPFMVRMANRPGDTGVSLAGGPGRGDGTTDEQRIAQARVARQNELMNEASRLELHSVLGGSVPVARISDSTVGVGDTIGSFTVAVIEGRSVTLESDGWKFNLTMQAVGEKQNNNFKRPGSRRK